MKLQLVRKPRSAGLAWCSSAFMASTAWSAQGGEVRSGAGHQPAPAGPPASVLHDRIRIDPVQI